MTVKTSVPSPAGVPLISPVSSFRLSPSGRTPLTMLHVMGAVPLAVKRLLYASPSMPSGRLSATIVGGIGGRLSISFTRIAAVTAGSGC